MEYVFFANGGHQVLERRDLAQLRHNFDYFVTARLSTGLFGSTRCVPGNRGPKTTNNVVLAFDDDVKKLVEFGFIPCNFCETYKDPKLWKIIGPTVQHVYENDQFAVDSLEKFADKKIVPYDVRRILWEDLAPITGIPDTFFLPPGLSRRELREFKHRIEALDFDLPPCQYYDQNGKRQPYKI